MSVFFGWKVGFITKKWKSKREFKTLFIQKAKVLFDKEVKELDKKDVYIVLANMLKDLMFDDWMATERRYDAEGTRQVYYFCIEFLLGRLLDANLLNCGMEDLARSALKDLGFDLDEIMPMETDPGLGNGGLGRLAACFIDSMAALQLPGNGCSIRYQYGLFDQRIIDGQQVELPDAWLRDGFPWETKRSDKAVYVRFGGNAYMRPGRDGNLECIYEKFDSVRAVPYDVPVPGYHNHTVNNLRLWKAEYTTEGIYSQLRYGDYRRALRYKDVTQQISRFLYPDDSTIEGRRLRLLQEYFLVSAGVQSIMRHFKSHHGDPREFDKYNAIHINDTHPALVIPELMRILMDEEGLSWDEAWTITKNSVAYTNHTVMPEALEQWPISMFQPLLPRIYLILDELNRRFLEKYREKFPNREDKAASVAILWGGQVRMANLAVIGSHSVNGVAKLHTKILETSTLKQFYEIYPERFSNKTNGVTHRRWLLESNPPLASLISDAIGSSWIKKPSRLEELMDFRDDPVFLEKLGLVKQGRKNALAEWLFKTKDIKVDPLSVFDIQVKRFHMYKRQLLNILHVYYLYRHLLDDPNFIETPQTFIFGGKAAASYGEAKIVIRLIHTVARLIDREPNARAKLKVIFLENYNVSLGQRLFPAADVSEQISTAGKEASGTGNMKFMMNGAITLGTLDGANVEIYNRVGDENCVIFGLRANEVQKYYNEGGYSSWDLYRNDADIRMIMDVLKEEPMYGQLYEALLARNDEFFVLKDFKSYCAAHEEVLRRYADHMNWLKSSTVNIAQSGYFSSDRTVTKYAEDIWHIKPVKI
ncbi:MAG: glycogen/starch/alpha-glucan phosphorylase [Acidaminococcus sp.]|jgi:starch phosphorylase|nr:glycogen/starch/alpha-glucan phosphorylase [Acidaminococcus sp.]MCI2100239.1 glycogen/starch/alpha-glucan phosphorylase [Acidaminococcus sp.]MCI2114559.1 glycogen/starch/alpha-glucan phosphorylase [Acidaminococcus sp.]MCI2116536.1 glycogen/starch/alpha-glucan phosphorylase [Acidaminococcus sp.]